MRALFAVSIALIINSLKSSLQSRLLLASLLLLSPGVELMLYNGNFDLLIFAMVILAHFAIQRGNVNWGLFLIFLSGLFKFYTIPLLLLFALLLPRFRNKIASIILFLIATTSAIMDLRQMQEQIPSTGYAQFGLTIFSKYLEEVGFSLSAVSVYAISLGLFSLMAFSIILLLKNQGIFEGFKITARNQLYLVLSTVFISCFMTGISYDPRLIYLTLASFLLVHATAARTPRVLIWIGIMASSLLSCGIELGLIPRNQTGFHPLRSIQLINDLAIEFLSVLIFLNLLQWLFQQLRVQLARS
jgi:hypothetical protein